MKNTVEGRKEGRPLLLCVLRKRKTKVMSARLVIIIPSNLQVKVNIQYSEEKARGLCAILALSGALWILD